MRKYFTLMVLCCGLMAMAGDHINIVQADKGRAVKRASAGTATVLVGDGSTSSEVFPILNWWMDTYQGTEVIYYADELGMKKGDRITALTYYCVQNSAYGGNFNVRIKNTSASRIPDLDNDGHMEDPSVLLVSYDDAVNGNVELGPYGAGDEITFELSNPFVYEGGNIVVDIRNTRIGVEQWLVLFFRFRRFRTLAPKYRLAMR